MKNASGISFWIRCRVEPKARKLSIVIGPRLCQVQKIIFAFPAPTREADAALKLMKELYLHTEFLCAFKPSEVVACFQNDPVAFHTYAKGFKDLFDHTEDWLRTVEAEPEWVIPGETFLAHCLSKERIDMLEFIS